MRKTQWLKPLFYLNAAIVVMLIVYKLYLNLADDTPSALHSKQLDAISTRIAEDAQYSFAVVGNINNSIGIFERRILPELNEGAIDFVVSAGNAVSGGGEDKYRALQGTLSHLKKPYLLTFGDNEHDDFGSFRFYEYYGPHFFSFSAGQSRFIFLDSTGKTPWQWQIRWLKDLLQNDRSKYRFVFIGHPLFEPETEFVLAESEDYLQPVEFREQLLSILVQFEVDRVFSSNIAIYSEHLHKGVPFISTGGAGGFVLNQEESFYHYIKVTVGAESGVHHEVVELPIGQHPILKQLESLWLFIHSLFFVGYLNFILLVSLFLAISIKLYHAIFIGKVYYPNYDIDPEPWLKNPLKIAMFTNNYLPFIGGVPISIERLRHGLTRLKDSVLIVAPCYRSVCKEEPNILRLPSLVSFGEKREFRLANIFFFRAVHKKIKAFKPDIIHVHHPFWVGSLGVYLAKRIKVPVVYTYHTRLEHYAHFVPLPGDLFRNIIVHALIKRFANRCDSIIVPTQSAEEYLRMIGVTSATYVQPTGIEYARFRQRDDEAVATLKEQQNITDETVFISVARLSNEKNIDFIIEALAQLKAQTSKAFRLLMIGDGHQRQRLEAKARALGLSTNITFVGAIAPEQMPQWYQLGDLFLFASQSETQGMVILEAMAAGLPVVAVRSSGIDDIVIDGVNGFKTPARKALWLQKVQLLLEAPKTRQKLAQKAVASAARHSVENFTQEVRLIYAETLARSYEKTNS